MPGTSRAMVAAARRHTDEVERAVRSLTVDEESEGTGHDPAP